MARALTYRRHGRHSSYDRITRRAENQAVPGLNQDTRRFAEEQDARLGGTASGPKGVFDAMMLVQDKDESFSFDDVRAADEAADVGLFVPQRSSIDFDGAAEFMGSGFKLLGIANTWTIAGWFKFGDVATRSGTLLEIHQAAGLNNLIRVFQRDAGPTGPLAIQLFLTDSAGATLQNVSWQNILSVGVWHHVAIQWDGTAAGRKLFLDGVDQGVPGFIDTSISGTMTTTARAVVVGRAASGIPNHDGLAASLAIWNKILAPAEMTEVYNGGSIAFDLASDGANYARAANLQHWLQLGRELSPNLGKDFGIGVPLLDLEGGAVGITDADRIADVP